MKTKCKKAIVLSSIYNYFTYKTLRNLFNAIEYCFILEIVLAWKRGVGISSWSMNKVVLVMIENTFIAKRNQGNQDYSSNQKNAIQGQWPDMENRHTQQRI